MPTWIIYLISSIVPELFKRKNKKKYKEQLVKDLKEVDEMDITLIEKAAIKKSLIERYADDRH